MQMTETEWKEMVEAWNEEHDNGNGEPFDFGDSEGYAIEGTVADAIDRPDVILIAALNNQAIIQLAEAFDPHKVLMVCDVDGAPWVCDVNSSFRRIEARNNLATGVYPS